MLIADKDFSLHRFSRRMRWDPQWLAVLDLNSDERMGSSNDLECEGRLVPIVFLIALLFDITRKVGCAPGGGRRGVAIADEKVENQMARAVIRQPRSRSVSHEIFISYAHEDDKPQQPGDDKGWVTALYEAVLADHKRFSTEPLRIFFDTTSILTMDYWEDKIRNGLRHSSILLVCLSPNYFKSAYCRMEWEEYGKRQVHKLMGMDSIAPVYFVAAPDVDAEDVRKWKETIGKSQYVDLQEWYPKGLQALREEAVRKKLDALGTSLWQRIQSARRAFKAEGNMRSCNVRFVGRRREVCQLHETLAKGAIGVVAAVHGLGGMGKTELAVAYAHGYADSYPGGLWLLDAEGRSELLPLIGDLAGTPELPLELSPRLTAEERGKHALAELKRRAEAVASQDPDGGAACLLVLDNVSEPALLSPSQLVHLPRERFDWLRVVATTRLGRDDLYAPSAKTLDFVPVDALDEEDALQLLREHQNGEHWSHPEDEEYAREIVLELGCFTLAIEQVAIHLGLHPDLRPKAYLARLRREGLPSADALGKNSQVAAQMFHQEKQFAVVLVSTLTRFTPIELATLDYAALLPPESIPWPWLREAVKQDFPRALDFQAGDVDPWLSIRRHLEGARLLVPGNHPETGRMHRLAGSYLREQMAGDAMARRQENIQAVVWLFAVELQNEMLKNADYVVPARLWMLGPMQEYVLHFSHASHVREFAIVAQLVGRIEMRTGRLDKAGPFLMLATERLDAIYAMEPDSNQAAFDTAGAKHMLADWYRMRGNKGDAEVANDLFNEAFSVSQKITTRYVESPGQDQGGADSNSTSSEEAAEAIPRAIEAFEAALGTVEAAEAASLGTTWEYGDDLSAFQVAPHQMQDEDQNEEPRSWFFQSLFENSYLLNMDANKLDEALLLDLGNMEHRLSLGTWNMVQCSPGDAQVLSDLQKTLRLAQEIYERNQDSVLSRRCLAMALSCLGEWHNLRKEDGDAATSVGYFQEATMIYREIYEIYPDSVQAAKDLSNGLLLLGACHTDRRHSEDMSMAFNLIQESLDITNRLYTKYPDSVVAAYDMARRFENFAVWHLTRNQGVDADVALDYYQKTLAISRRLYALNPDSDKGSDRLIRILTMLGRQYAQRATEKDLEVARGYFQEVLDICRKLNIANQESPKRAYDLCDILEDMSALCIMSGNGGDVATAFGGLQEALKIVRKLRHDEAATKVFDVKLSTLLRLLAQWYEKYGMQDHAAEFEVCLHEALAINRKLYASNPGAMQVAHELVCVLALFSDWYGNRGNDGDAKMALDCLREAYDVVGVMYRGNQDASQAAHDVLVVLDRLASWHLAHDQDGDRDIPLYHLQEAKEIACKVFRGNPSSDQAACDAALTLDKLGGALCERGQEGDLDQALGLYEECLDIRRSLLRPSVSQSYVDCIYILKRVANMLFYRKQYKDIDRARFLAEERIALCQELHESTKQSPSCAQELIDAYLFLGHVVGIMGRYIDMYRMICLAMDIQKSYHKHGLALKIYFEDNYNALIVKTRWIMRGMIFGLIALLGGGGYMLYRWLR
jgi:tetratricopeptide (TPR) repeat protein